jgi:hypothetical protein
MVWWSVVVVMTALPFRSEALDNGSIERFVRMARVGMTTYLGACPDGQSDADRGVVRFRDVPRIRS